TSAVPEAAHRTRGERRRLGSPLPRAAGPCLREGAAPLRRATLGDLQAAFLDASLPRGGPSRACPPPRGGPCHFWLGFPAHRRAGRPPVVGQGAARPARG